MEPIGPSPAEENTAPASWDGAPPVPPTEPEQGAPVGPASAPAEPTVSAASGPTAQGQTAQSPRFRERSRGWWGRALGTSGAASPMPAAPEASPAVEQATVPIGVPAPLDRRRRQQRGAIAALLAVVVLAIAIWRLTSAGSGGAAPAPTPVPAPTTPPFVSVPGATLTAQQVLGAGAGLNTPREAIPLANGHIVVADTVNSRLVLLDAAGHVLRVIRRGAGPIQQPYAVAAAGSGFYMLDAGRGTVERYSLAGRFERLIVRNPLALTDAHGMAVAADGTIYVANPRTNSVDAYAPAGALLHRFTSSSGGTGPSDWNQPSDVAVGANGDIYAVELYNATDRIKAITPAGTFVGQWIAPASFTFESDHVLPLHDGRILATDPSGALLVYPQGQGEPTRLPLQVAGRSPGKLMPLGLALLGQDRVLVTDAAGNRLLVVPLPR